MDRMDRRPRCEAEQRGQKVRRSSYERISWSWQSIGVAAVGAPRERKFHPSWKCIGAAAVGAPREREIHPSWKCIGVAAVGAPSNVDEATQVVTQVLKTLTLSGASGAEFRE